MPCYKLDFKELGNLQQDMHRTIIQGETSGKDSITMVQVQKNN